MFIDMLPLHGEEQMDRLMMNFDLHTSLNSSVQRCLRPLGWRNLSKPGIFIKPKRWVITYTEGKISSKDVSKALDLVKDLLKQWRKIHG
jgi:hypothetical protein